MICLWSISEDVNEMGKAAVGNERKEGKKERKENSETSGEVCQDREPLKFYTVMNKSF